VLKQSITLLLVSEASLSSSCYQQIFGDPAAADIVLTSGADILAMGLNVTHQVGVSCNSAALEGCILSALDVCCIKNTTYQSIHAQA
jgi:hypothetical protein